MERFAAASLLDVSSLAHVRQVVGAQLQRHGHQGGTGIVPDALGSAAQQARHLQGRQCGRGGSRESERFGEGGWGRREGGRGRGGGEGGGVPTLVKVLGRCRRSAAGGSSLKSLTTAMATGARTPAVQGGGRHGQRVNRGGRHGQLARARARGHGRRVTGLDSGSGVGQQQADAGQGAHGRHIGTGGRASCAAALLTVSVVATLVHHLLVQGGQDAVQQHALHLGRLHRRRRRGSGSGRSACILQVARRAPAAVS